MKPILFHVKATGEFRPVELAFAGELEVRRVRGANQKRGFAIAKKPL